MTRTGAENRAKGRFDCTVCLRENKPGTARKKKMPTFQERTANKNDDAANAKTNRAWSAFPLYFTTYLHD